MATRQGSPRRVKRHRSYTVDEASKALDVAKGTVRRWMKLGLPFISDQRPYLILGDDLVAFLGERRPAKRTCAINECYCFKCRAPRAAAGGMAELTPLSTKSGNLRALCSTCSGLMHKRVSLARLPELRGILDVTIRQADTPIDECSEPSLNDHFPKKGSTHA